MQLLPTRREPPDGPPRLRIVSDREVAPTYSISDLAREFALTTRAIRFYEDKGLLSPRRINGARVYTRRDRARLALILRAKAIGSSLAKAAMRSFTSAAAHGR